MREPPFEVPHAQRLKAGNSGRGMAFLDPDACLKHTVAYSSLDEAPEFKRTVLDCANPLNPGS